MEPMRPGQKFQVTRADCSMVRRRLIGPRKYKTEMDALPVGEIIVFVGWRKVQDWSLPDEAVFQRSTGDTGTFVPNREGYPLEDRVKIIETRRR